MKKHILLLFVVASTAWGASPSFQQVTNVLQAPLVKTNDARKLVFTNAANQFVGTFAGAQPASGNLTNWSLVATSSKQDTLTDTITLTNSTTLVSYIINLAAGTIQLRSNNVAKVTIDKTGTVLASAGAAGTPGFGWQEDSDGSGTGFYRNSANRIAISVNGSFLGQILSTGYELGAPISTFTALTGNGTASISGVSNAAFAGKVSIGTNNLIDALYVVDTRPASAADGEGNVEVFRFGWAAYLNKFGATNGAGVFQLKFNTNGSSFIALHGTAGHSEIGIGGDGFGYVLANSFLADLLNDYLDDGQPDIDLANHRLLTSNDGEGNVRDYWIVDNAIGLTNRPTWVPPTPNTGYTNCVFRWLSNDVIYATLVTDTSTNTVVDVDFSP